ncbi:MAG: excinuclease subunit [Bacteroidetes bacterium]|nr:excinuclease subunit [Bacteroidota bacterium]
MNKASFKTIIAGIPEKPGIYQFFDRNKDLLYIGKAKNLKKRVTSYFHHYASSNRKLQILVNKIADVVYMIVDTESDALLLENSLIKKHQPRYNVLLKDDKTFPWICIKNEPFPRVFSTRRIEKDNSEYFGPYTSVVMVKTLMDLIRKLFTIRTCSFNLSADNIKKGKLKICLEYHLKNCKGPCEGFQSEDDYNSGVNQIREILRGNLISVIEHLTDLMQKYASDYRFEEADIVKHRIELLKKYKGKSTIVNTGISNVDVFSIAMSEKFATVNYFKVINGAIIQSHNLELVHKLEESKEELMAIAIGEIMQRFKSNPAEIIVPFYFDSIFGKTKITVPRSGDKKKLLDLSIRNANAFLADRLKARNNIKKAPKEILLLEKLKEDLRLKSIPSHIECFDNSNILGSSPVASCVVFKNGKPSRDEYRHFNIKTVTGPDDYASMSEIIYRRYKRLLDENKELPELIIIDGGKGQLSAAVKSLEALNLSGRISIIAIAKRLEEIFVPQDPVPIYLDKHSLSLRIIQHARNEAHRFGISFHKLKRSKVMLTSELDKIDGIGKVAKDKLLQHFGDIENIKAAEIETLNTVVSKKQANIVFEHFRKG